MHLRVSAGRTAEASCLPCGAASDGLRRLDLVTRCAFRKGRDVLGRNDDRDLVPREESRADDSIQDVYNDGWAERELNTVFAWRRARSMRDARGSGKPCASRAPVGGAAHPVHRSPRESTV